MTIASSESLTVRSQRSWLRYPAAIFIWVLIAAGVWVCAVKGLQLRRWVYETADPIHFNDDMRRGTFWGLNASGPEGYLNQYDKMAPQIPEWQDSKWTPWLDYSPLRLLVMREWGVWQRKYHPPNPNVPLMDAWQRSYEFTSPVLRFNETLEGFAAVCAFFLTRLWVGRGTSVEKRGHFTGVWQGLVAALMIWFSPDIIVNAHAWPQWDNWVVPWFLCGCLLASLDWWFAAGVAIAIGANLKGQMLSISPIFIIWPLVQGRVGAALRWVCGAVFCFAMIASGWLITYLPADRLAAVRKIQADLVTTDYPPNLFAIPRVVDIPAVIWIVGMLIAIVGVRWLLHRRRLAETLEAGVGTNRRRTWYAVAASCIIVAVCWPWFLSRNNSSWYLGFLAGAVVAAAALCLPRRSLRYVIVGTVGVGLLLCMTLFHGSSAWWNCAVQYGSNHWPFMYIGPTSNLPAILQERYGFDRHVDQIFWTVPGGHGHWLGADFDITAKLFFNTIYGVLLVVSGIAIGVQTKRNDRRALVAFVTPWIMFFVFPVQIQERYLLYASGAAACCIGNSVGMALLGLLLSVCSMIMQMQCMMDAGWSDVYQFGQNLSRALPWLFSPQCGERLHSFFRGVDPDMGWGILLVGLVFLYLSVTPSRRVKESQSGRRLDRARRSHAPAL